MIDTRPVLWYNIIQIWVPNVVTTYGTATMKNMYEPFIHFFGKTSSQNDQIFKLAVLHRLEIKNECSVNKTTFRS